MSMIRKIRTALPSKTCLRIGSARSAASRKTTSKKRITNNRISALQSAWGYDIILTMSEIKYPVVAHHRLIVNAEAKNEAETRAVFKDFKLVEPIKEVNASSSGKYVSFSLSVKLESKEETAKLDEAIARVPGLKMCL